MSRWSLVLLAVMCAAAWNESDGRGAAPAKPAAKAPPPEARPIRAVPRPCQRASSFVDAAAAAGGAVRAASHHIDLRDDARRGARPGDAAHYDALMIYANHTTITPAQEKALLDFVEGGKGLVALHCAVGMFTESPRYVALVGGEFQRHGTGRVHGGDRAARRIRSCRGSKPFTTWDETYVHTQAQPGRSHGAAWSAWTAKGREPYTWVRTQGKGRVFYTAFGHDAAHVEPSRSSRSSSSTARAWAVGDAGAPGVAAAEDAGGRSTSTASTCPTTRTATRRRSISCRSRLQTR